MQVMKVGKSRGFRDHDIGGVSRLIYMDNIQYNIMYNATVLFVMEYVLESDLGK